MICHSKSAIDHEGSHVQQLGQAATAGTTADIAPEPNIQQLAAALATTLVTDSISKRQSLSNITSTHRPYSLLFIVLLQSTVPHAAPQLYTIHCSQQKVSSRFSIRCVCVCVFACEGPEVHSTHRVVSFHQAGNMGKTTL
jgi:hypothetical protein